MRQQLQNKMRCKIEMASETFVTGSVLIFQVLLKSPNNRSGTKHFIGNNNDFQFYKKYRKFSVDNVLVPGVPIDTKLLGVDITS